MLKFKLTYSLKTITERYFKFNWKIVFFLSYSLQLFIGIYWNWIKEINKGCPRDHLLRCVSLTLRLHTQFGLYLSKYKISSFYYYKEKQT